MLELNIDLANGKNITITDELTFFINKYNKEVRNKIKNSDIKNVKLFIDYYYISVAPNYLTGFIDKLNELGIGSLKNMLNYIDTDRINIIEDESIYDYGNELIELFLEYLENN